MNKFGYLILAVLAVFSQLILSSKAYSSGEFNNELTLIPIPGVEKKSGDGEVSMCGEYFVVIKNGPMGNAIMYLSSIQVVDFQKNTSRRQIISLITQGDRLPVSIDETRMRPVITDVDKAIVPGKIDRKVPLTIRMNSVDFARASNCLVNVTEY